MGQTNSSSFQKLLPNVYSELFNKDPNTIITKEIRELDHDKFLEIISEMNSLSREYFDNEGKQMIFAIREGSDKSVLWKAVVEIACIKIDPQANKVESYRSLSLVKLMKVFYTLKNQDAAKDQSEQNVVSYEDIVSGLDKGPDLFSVCIICLERKMELSLPCAHSFCSKCIEEWNSKHNTCPICRDELETNDSWILSEKPKADEISKELKLSLLNLTEERSDSCAMS